MKTELVKLGDLVVITAGVPVGRSGTTNLIKIHHIGEMIAKGQGIGTQSATGKVVVASNPQEAIEKTTDGSILVCPVTDKDYMPAFEKAAAVITETGGITSPCGDRRAQPGHTGHRRRGERIKPAARRG